MAAHLWQSTLFAAAAWGLTLTLRRHRAAIRYGIWLAASLKFLIPLSWLMAAGRLIPWRTLPAPVPDAITAAVSQVFVPRFMTISSAGTGAAANAVDWSAVATSSLFGIWALGSAIVARSWWREWRRCRTALTGARAVAPSTLNLPDDVRVLVSQDVLEPAVFGLWRSVLIVPDGIFDRLTAAERQAIVAHEVCHIRRRDNLAAALHMLVEAVFWFHPLVWWIEHRLVEERERACDEAVVLAGIEPRTYAEGILNVCRFSREVRLLCASGVTGADLQARIEAIMTARVLRTLSVGGRAALAVAAALAIAAPIVAGAVRAQAPQPPGAATAIPPGPAPKIEVASVKRNTTNEPGPQFRAAGGLNIRGIAVHLLLEMAYGVHAFQIEGAPGWTESERYDVQAKLEGVTGIFRPDDPRSAEVFRNLLESRFQLKAHRETKDGSTYALNVARGGPKLTVAEGTRPPYMRGQQGYFSGTMDLATLCDLLAWRLERPVVNRTGLNGIYDLELAWTADTDSQTGRMLPPPPPPPPAGPASGPMLPMRTPRSDVTPPSLFTAIQEQLGLRLDSVRGPIEFVVIDRIERPTEN